ncbi:MAG: radical SAM protein [Candidatus Omnitrophica bacterium]|nr:radical SAM protein [Candidatus Omnitrophota bacterium]
MHKEFIDKIKQYGTERIISKAIRLFANFSDSNLIRLSYLLEKFIIQENQKEALKLIRELCVAKHPFIQLLKRVSKGLNPQCRDKIISNIIVKAFFTHQPKREEFKAREGFYPPSNIVISSTVRCNLHCESCWAAKYVHVPDLEMSLLQRIIKECLDLGINFITITGGEPFIRGDLLDLYEKYPDVFFHIYTNGTLIDEEVTIRLAEMGNVAPMISIEGDQEMTDARRGKGVYERIMRTMDLLREKGVGFGFSVMSTRNNVEMVTSDEFVDLMLKKGCFNGWYFQYIPIGLNPDISLMLTPEQRDFSRRRLYRLRNTKPIFLVDFWNDGPVVNGCMAGGRNYLHINPFGDVEPCVFAHFAVDNIRNKSLVEILKSPFFTAIREAIPYDGNTLRACMIVDRPHLLRKYVKEFNAYPTHEGAEGLITTLSKDVDEYANGVAQIYNKAWQEGDWISLFLEQKLFDKRLGKER